MLKRKTNNKFKAVQCERDQKKFPSKLERNYYDILKIRQMAGEVIYFHRQPLFDLPGGVSYRADFQVFLSDGTIEYIDTKGVDTPMSKAKRKMVEAIYPIEIKIVKKV